ncbi:MAG: hypothetical protein M3436_17840 [Pseudomonadota bacterium]|nr:hypothetical protein [Pseudomonadota bacterium]
MRAFCAAFFLATASLMAQWSEIKPTHFEPLTSVPWDEKGATSQTVLGAIFREPNLAIRYRVLDEYLRQIPATEIGRAFELCVPLESTQNPDDLVELFIPIWVERDPAACWDWVKKLFRVVGIENGVLGYDSWTLPRISVQDLEAIRASPFWIQREALMGFPVALDRSALAKEERVRIMKEFAEMWFKAFSSWPGYPRPVENAGRYLAKAHRNAGKPLVDSLRYSLNPETLEHINRSRDPAADLQFEIVLRRMLRENPASAVELVNKAREKWPPPPEIGGERLAGPSDELLLIWAKSDLPGMVRWVESLDMREGDLAVRAKGLMMSLVDATTRNRWLAEAKAALSEEHREASLFEAWAQWDLEAALLAVSKAGDPESARGLANAGAYGPWRGQPWNASRHAFRVLTAFDFSKLPPRVAELALDDCYSLMEQWDSMDVAGAARFGFAYLLRTNYAPRRGLIQFFSGKNIYGREDGMIDRTFCALRVWAVVRPDEMRKWIATVNDAEMRKALTWLLENPWGTGEEE